MWAVGFVCAWSVAASEDPHREAQVKFARNSEKKKVFSGQWFGAANGVLNATLVWENYGATDAAGYRLHLAQRVRLMEPWTAQDCLIGMNGVLRAPTEQGNPNPISIRFRGESCREAFEQILQGRVPVFFLEQVQMANESQIRRDLTLKFLESALED